MKKLIVAILKKIAPKYYMLRTINRMKKNNTEVELRLLPFLCNPKMMSLDIGASEGLYSFQMIDYSKFVVAFEARPEQAANLSSMLALVTEKASVESVGLSDKNGEATIRMLSNDLGRSTIENENTLENKEDSSEIRLKIKVRKLDGYDFKNIGLIKIDVEGHELAVLQGAEKTISKNHPSLLIEIEERHKNNSIEKVASFLENYGYSGFFIHNNKLNTIASFNLLEHQNVNNVGTRSNNYEKKGIYINNFIFIPAKNLKQFSDSCQQLMQW